MFHWLCFSNLCLHMQSGRGSRQIVRKGQKSLWKCLWSRVKTLFCHVRSIVFHPPASAGPKRGNSSPRFLPGKLQPHLNSLNQPSWCLKLKMFGFVQSRLNRFHPHLQEIVTLQWWIMLPTCLQLQLQLLLQLAANHRQSLIFFCSCFCFVCCSQTQPASFRLFENPRNQRVGHGTVCVRRLQHCWKPLTTHPAECFR